MLKTLISRITRLFRNPNSAETALSVLIQPQLNTVDQMSQKAITEILSETLQYQTTRMVEQMYHKTKPALDAYKIRNIRWKLDVFYDCERLNN
jgi:hypothetical protein